MICNYCGQLKGVSEYDNKLWELYDRRRDGRQFGEPLVYTQDDLWELGYYGDDLERDSIKMSMENNMVERGLCPECGRPDLAGMEEDDFMDDEEAKDAWEYQQEIMAERRMGC